MGGGVARVMATPRASNMNMEMDCSGARRRPAPVETAAEPAPEEMRVLAVDDNNIDRKLVEMLLKTSKFKGAARGMAWHGIVHASIE